MKTYENLRKSIKTNETYENLWQSMKTYKILGPPDFPEKYQTHCPFWNNAFFNWELAHSGLRSTRTPFGQILEVQFLDLELWKHMKTCESIWKPMKIYGNLWKSMNMYENLWKSMRILTPRFPEKYQAHFPF